MPTPANLRMNPWPGARWGPEDKPVLLLDGTVHRVRRLGAPLSGEAAYAVGIDDASLRSICRHLDVRSLSLYEMRVADLEPLTQLADLRGLAIRWNTKLSDIAPLERLGRLEELVLEHVPRVFDLSPLGSLRRLRFLDFSGGTWARNRVSTLLPLAELPALEELVLTNLSVERDGLRPLAGCRRLRSLTLSNQFPTDDYAFLSVRLPDTACELFAPFLVLTTPIDGKDVMVTGKGKPFLDQARDRERLERYVAAFKALRDRHAKTVPVGGGHAE